MLKIGVTGGIGSGKSTVCSIFKCLGVPVFHADEIGRNILIEDRDAKQKVMQLFDSLDRKKIAAIVFNDKEKLVQLNAIIHPKVRQAFIEWTDKQKAPFIIEEAAILFESGVYKMLDCIIVVTAPEELRIQRVISRDGVSEVTIRERMKNQWSEEEKIKLADFVIHNNEEGFVIPQVLDIYKQLISKGLNK
jgi:dephospho-CoA kinase